MKALVFGSKGYLGKHTSYYLKKKGFDVWEDANYKIDISELKTLEAIDWNVDYVYIFAGKTGTLTSFDDYETFIKVNVLGLLNILNSIKKSSFNPKVIFPSTRLVYKGSNIDLTEEAEKEPKSIYAINKLACEKYLYAYANAYGINFTIFRISVPYGNFLINEYSYGTIGNFIKQAKSKNKISLYGDGMYKRTFTYMEDLIKYIVQVVQLKESDHEIFNIPGQNLSLFEVAKLISHRLNCELEFIEYPDEIKKIESGNTSFNFEKIKKLIPIKENKDIKDWINSINL